MATSNDEKEQSPLEKAVKDERFQSVKDSLDDARRANQELELLVKQLSQTILEKDNNAKK